MDGLIAKQLSAVMKDLKPVTKDGINTTPGQNYKYRKIEDIYNAVHESMAKNDVIHTVDDVTVVRREPFVSKSGAKGWHTEMKFTFKFIASDNSYVNHIEFGEAIDYGDKGYSKAGSNAHKYALIKFFVIPTDDLIDTDKETHVPPQRKVEIPNLAKKFPPHTGGR